MELQVNKLQLSTLFVIWSWILIQLCVLQVAGLRRLQQENQTAAERLRDEVRNGEILHEQVQQVLSDIAQHQLNAEKNTEK